MTVQVIMKDGTVKEILVRWSSFLKCLFTTARVLEVKGVKFEDMECASAPFRVFKADWCISGIIEDDDYFRLENYLGDVPFGIRTWNYL